MSTHANRGVIYQGNGTVKVDAIPFLNWLLASADVITV